MKEGMEKESDSMSPVKVNMILEAYFYSSFLKTFSLSID